MNIQELINQFKFGYTGETIDLIYLFLMFRFFMWPILYKAYQIVFNKERKCN